MADRQKTQQFVLPGCLNFFQNSDGKCEHNIKTARPVLLRWKDKIHEGEDEDKFATKQNFFRASTKTNSDVNDEDAAAAQEEEESKEDDGL